MKRIIALWLVILNTTIALSQKGPQPKLRQINSAKLNEVITSEIGDKMIEKGIVYEIEAVQIDSIPKGPRIKSGKTLYKGEILPFRGMLNGYKLYILDDRKTDFEGIAIKEKTGKVCVIESNIGFPNIINMREPIQVTITSLIDKSRDSFSQQFIFNGKSGNTLKFTYREFANDLARPAFSQELQYDISESKIIGFKGMRIEVLNASNTNIEYKVLSSFN